MEHLFRHFLITRFNVPWVNGKSPDEIWLKNRIELFLQYCLPSVYQQTNKNFSWIIYLDEKTQKWALQILRKKIQSNTFLIQVSAFDVMKQQVSDDVLRLCDENTKFVITSRLDNDDIISPYYMDLIQKNFKPLNNGFINFNKGLCYHVDKCIFSEYQYINGPFVSKIENIKERITTILEHDHTFLNAPIQIKGNHWIQLIHKSNISNDLKGKILINKSLLHANKWIANYDFIIYKYSAIYWRVHQVKSRLYFITCNILKKLIDRV